jgi:hypothetical protein
VREIYLSRRVRLTFSRSIDARSKERRRGSAAAAAAAAADDDDACARVSLVRECASVASDACRGAVPERVSAAERTLAKLSSRT